MSTPVAAADVSVTFDGDLESTTYSGAALVEAGRRMAGAVAQAVQGLGQLGRAMNGTASGHFRSKPELRPAPPVLREPLPLAESMMLLLSSVEAAAEQRDDMRPNRYDSLRAQVVVDFAYLRRRGPKSTKAKQRTSPLSTEHVDEMTDEHLARLGNATRFLERMTTTDAARMRWSIGPRRIRYTACRRDAWARQPFTLRTTEWETVTLPTEYAPMPTTVEMLGQSSGSLRVVGMSSTTLTLDRRSTRVEPRQVTGKQPKLPKSRRRKRR